MTGFTIVAVLSGGTLFVEKASTFQQMTKQTTLVVIGSLRLNCCCCVVVFCWTECHLFEIFGSIMNKICSHSPS